MGGIAPRGPVGTCGAGLGCHNDYQHSWQVQNTPWAHDKLSLGSKPASINPLLAPPLQRTPPASDLMCPMLWRMPSTMASMHSRRLWSHDNTSSGSGHC